MVDLRPDQLATVTAILLAEVPDYEIWAFGSRARWTAKDSSDLDLAIVSESPLSSSRLSHLKQAFEQSYLPFSVDVVDLSKVSPEFRKVIEKQRVVFRKANENGIGQHVFSERRSLPLEDAIETIIDYRGKTPKKVDSGIPLITAKIIKNGRIDTPTEFISPDDYDEWMRRGLPQAGDVLLTMEAPLGEVAQLETGKVALAQRLVALRGKKNLLDNDFLKYLLQSREVQDQLRSRASGTTVQGIKQSELRKINLTLPKLDEQRAIANVLGTLDKKIELNQRMNETLEAMSQALFKSWFLDKTQNGMPKGWRESAISDVATNIQYGLTQSASEEPVGPRFLRITDIQGGRVDWANVPFCRVSPNEQQRYRLKPGDILVARTGASTGENIYLPTVPDAVFASYLVRFQFNDPAVGRYVGAFMRTPAYFDYVKGCIGGSAQPNASAQVLAKANLPIPPADLVSRFAETVAPLDERIASNNEESRTLAALRDALLPKLLSGTLRVDPLR
jgi:type I restriction enzyme S subunit